MGGTLWVCGPGQTTGDVSDTDDGVSMYYRYSGFTDFKGIALKATIAFLTALSGKQISKALLVEEEIVDLEKVEGLDEGVVIANYRARIGAAIALLKSLSWLNTKPKPGAPTEHPFLKLFNAPHLTGVKPPPELVRVIDQQALLANFIADIPIDFNVVNPHNRDPKDLAPPHTLTELRLGGIHAFVLFPDVDGTLEYGQVKEVEWLLRKVRAYCEWGKDWGAPPPPEYQPPRVRVPSAADESHAPSSDERDGDSAGSTHVEQDGNGYELAHDNGDELEEEEDDEDEDYDYDYDTRHFIDQMISVFAAVPPGGTART
ncbi:hypothetical protein C8R45DRAFT_999555 [Mycena sanguinolenta]|nr:hypothetical protein C8R45DRAFT_999555 [Mycena sanguinolenta]